MIIAEIAQFSELENICVNHAPFTYKIFPVFLLGIFLLAYCGAKK